MNHTTHPAPSSQVVWRHPSDRAYPHHRPQPPRLLVLLGLLIGVFASCGNSTLPAHATTAAGCTLQTAPYTVRQLGFNDRNLNNAWAPDSRHLAYASDGTIKVYDVVTNTTTQTLTPSLGAAAPEWSADGQHIFFSARLNGVIGEGPAQEITNHAPPLLYVMRADGSQRQTIPIDSPMPGGQSTIYWDSTTPAKFSPDGKHVGFSTLQGVTFQNGSIDPNQLQNAHWIMLLGDLVQVNGELHLQNVHPLNAPSPYWYEVKGFTRDGQNLLFGSSRGDGGANTSQSVNADVYAQNLATGAITRYTTNPAWEETFDINPAEGAIVFNSDRANRSVTDTTSGSSWVSVLTTNSAHHDLYLAGPQGDMGWTRRLTFDGDPAKGGWASSQPRWSPDGLAIRFQENEHHTNRTMLLTFTCPAR